RIEPGHERRSEGEGAVQVVQVVGRPLVVGEEQETEPDLSDEQGLREREQMGRDRPRAAAAPVDDPAPEGGEGADRDHGEGEGLVDGEHQGTSAVSTSGSPDVTSTLSSMRMPPNSSIRSARSQSTVSR